MKYICFLCLIFMFGCQLKSNTATNEAVPTPKVITEAYELFKAKKEKALLIVFPGAGGSAAGARAAFKVLESSKADEVSVLFMNFTNKLWIEESDLVHLDSIITNTIAHHEITTQNIFIGGMSVGGNVALTLSNYLKHKNAIIQPKGAFIVDSPIDLYALFESSVADTLRPELSEERLAEPKWIIRYFETQFSGQDSLLNEIQEISPFTLKTNNIQNIEALKTIDLRLYTEPDSIWWQTNRQTKFENTNAFTIQQLYALLKASNWQNVELIATQNKGYRLNGERHPHSWSIVDVDDLVNWMID